MIVITPLNTLSICSIILPLIPSLAYEAEKKIYDFMNENLSSDYYITLPEDVIGSKGPIGTYKIFALFGVYKN